MWDRERGWDEDEKEEVKDEDEEVSRWAEGGWGWREGMTWMRRCRERR